MKTTLNSWKFRIWLIAFFLNYYLFIFGKLSETGFIQLFLYSMGIMFIVNVGEKYVEGLKKAEV